jgi:serralysin
MNLDSKEGWRGKMMRFNSDLIESLILEKIAEAEPSADDLFSLLEDELTLMRKSNFEFDSQEQRVKDEKVLLDSAFETFAESNRDNSAFFPEIDNKLISAARLQDVLSPQAIAQVSPQEINFFDGSESAAILPFATAPFTGNDYIDGILWGGNHWVLGSERVIEYSFWGAGSESFDDYRGSDICTSAYNWLDHEITAVEAALQTWSNVANIEFVRVADNDPNATFGLYSVNCDQIHESGNAVGMFGPPEPNYPAGAGIGYLGWDWDGWEYGLQQGGGGFATIIHELGHGLGLAHPHDNGGGSPVYPGVTLGDYTDTGDFGLNQGVWTTMSYNDGLIANGLGGSSSYGLQATPMAFDVAAIQYLYGADPTFRTEDNFYVLPTSNTIGSFYSCIWDAGGIDTIAADGAGDNANIDLRPAPLTGANAGGFISSVNDIFGGFTIANGVTIENAVGGAGNDLIIGNDCANVLEGGAGNDTLLGMSGNDILVGGDGGDRLDGYGTTGTEYDELYGGAGSDTFILGGSWGVSYQGLGYATIKDWDLTSDYIKVLGSGDGYTLQHENLSGSAALDTSIYYGSDLIGVVEDSTNVYIERDFIFV